MPAPRAKIFQAFDALPGLRETLRQKEIEHEMVTRPTLSEEALMDLDLKVRSLNKGQRISVTSFEDGRYVKRLGEFLGMDRKAGLFFLSKDGIFLSDILEIDE